MSISGGTDRRICLRGNRSSRVILRIVFKISLFLLLLLLFVLAPITGQRIPQRLKVVNVKGVGSADTWRVNEAKELPLVSLDAIAEVLNAIEHGAVWPPSMLYALVPLIPKGGSLLVPLPNDR